MKEIKTIDQYNSIFGVKTEHPLVSVIDFSKVSISEQAFESRSIQYSYYAVFIKHGQQCEINYGRNSYDFQDGTLVFFAPGQIVNVQNIDKNYKWGGNALLFHPDLIRGTPLGQHMKEYNFFSYEANEALHVSQKELELIRECFGKIHSELEHPVDKHSKRLISSNIELLLNYCQRFYDRQFITRDNVNSDVLTKFESLLNTYFESEHPEKTGIPKVAHFAEQFHLSPNYFGDLIKKETGKSAQEYIQLAIIDTAKEKIFDKSKSVSEIAFELGFKYPAHFSRFFKQQVGKSPVEYRQMN